MSSVEREADNRRSGLCHRLRLRLFGGLLISFRRLDGGNRIPGLPRQIFLRIVRKRLLKFGDLLLGRI